MKLLFDQNISFRLIKKINSFFSDSHSVKELGLVNASDIEIWQYAKANGFTIVTFDSDFFDLNTLYGGPPKIIWLKTGNMSTPFIARLFEEKQDLIKDFIQNSESDFLLLSPKS